MFISRNPQFHPVSFILLARLKGNLSGSCNVRWVRGAPLPSSRTLVGGFLIRPAGAFGWPRVCPVHRYGYGCCVDDTAAAAAASTPDMGQQHDCVLFQKVLLRGLDDVPGPDGDPHVLAEKRRERRGKHEVSWKCLTASRL